MRLFFFYVLLVCGISLCAEIPQGGFYMQHYQYSGVDADSVVTAVWHNGDGTVYVATRTCVFWSDGAHWNSIQIPYNVRVIKQLSSQTWLAGTSKGLYVMQQKPDGSLWTKRIDYNQKVIADVTGIEVVGNRVFVGNNHVMYLYNVKTERLESVFVEPHNGFNGCFVHESNFYVVIKNKGVSMVNGGQLREVWQGLSGATIGGYVALGNGKTLVATTEGDFYIVDKKGISRDTLLLSCKSQVADGVVSMVSLDSSSLAIGTRGGGVLVLSKVDMHLIGTLNGSNGLLSGNVTALSSCAHGGLWVGTTAGVSKVDLNMPVRCFNYPGLSGDIESICFYNNELYVATSTGIFLLAGNRVTKPETFVKRELVTRVAFRTTVKGFPCEPTVDCSREEVAVRVENGHQRDSAAALSQGFVELIKASSKGNKLVETSLGLFAVTIDGVYAIRGQGALKVLSVDSCVAVDAVGALLVVASTTSVYLVDVSSNTTLDVLNLQSDKKIQSVGFCGGQLWSCAGSTVYKIPVLSSNIFGFPKAYVSDESDGISVVGDARSVFFMAGKKMLTIKEEVDSVVFSERFDAVIPSCSRHVCLLGKNGFVNNIIPSVLDPSRLSLLAVFGPRLVGKASRNDLMFVVGNKIFMTVGCPPRGGVNAFVSRVFTTRGRYLNLNKIELDGNTEGLVLMMAASDFILEENMRYRFKFDARDWTPWCGNPELVFHVLPPGKHIIQVEAQDVFGRISTLKPVTVEVGYTRADFVKYGLSSVLACIGTICIAVVWIRARKKRVSRVAT